MKSGLHYGSEDGSKVTTVGQCTGVGLRFLRPFTSETDEGSVLIFDPFISYLGTP